MSTEEYADQEGQASLPAVREKPELAVVPAPPQQNLTPQQARVVEVTEALKPAYEKASTLELTDGEVEALMAPFPDHVVDIRPHDGLIYISHIHISNRLNKVFKPGKWALVRRWEKFEAGTMYAEYVLLIRGCFVGEAIGGHPYIPSNPKQNYSDALEATAGEALRRIAGKRLSCGSQVWEGDYAKDWVAKYATQTNGKWQKRRDIPAPAPAAPAKAPVPAPAPKTKLPHDKADLLSTFRRYFPANMEESLVNFLRSESDSTGVSWLMPNEGLEDLSVEKLEILAKSPTKMLARVQQWMDSLADGETPATSTTADDEPWYKVVVPVPRKGMKRDEYLKNPDTIGSLYQLRHEDTEEGQLARQRLWGFVTNYEPKGWVKRDGTQMPPSESDIQFKEALEQFKAWFERNHPGEKL